MSNRVKKGCPWCHRQLDASAFRHGAKICVKCHNLALEGIAPTPPNVHPPPIKSREATENEVLFASLDASHVDRCKKAYYEYLALHPEEFRDGESIVVIDGEFVPRGYPNYEAASEAAHKMARGRKWAYFVRGHENPVSYMFPSIQTTLPFSGKYEDGSLVVYAETKIKGTTMDEVEEEKLVVKELNLLVDTGASMCALPVRIVTELGLEVIDTGHVLTGGGPQVSKVVEAQYNVRNLGYIKVRCQTYPKLEHQLLGLNYLTKCRHLWSGTADVQIGLLQPGETPEDSAEIQELINGLNRMDLSTSLVMQRLQQVEVLEHKLEEKNNQLIQSQSLLRSVELEGHAKQQQMQALNLILKDKDSEIAELLTALREVQRMQLQREQYEKSKRAR